MNPVERVGRALDRAQQRSRPLAFGYAVIKKFGDDQAGALAALIAYYAFFALFPLLLVLVTVLGILLRHDAALQQRILGSALADFPVLGNQLRGNVHSLNRTGFGLIVGVAGTFYGARGVASAGQNAFNTVWNVPFARRPGFPFNTLRSLGLLLVVGVGVVLSTAVTGAAGGSGSLGLAARIGALAVGTALNIGVFLLAFRLATSREIGLRQMARGAVLSALAWEGLQAAGGYLVAHQMRHASQVYGVFALVIGLLSWLHLQAQITLYVVEADVVRCRQLWPRSLAAPPLTGADRRAMRAQAEQAARRPEERIEVAFTED